MTLRELLGDGPDVVVTGLTFDNRLVAPGHPVLRRAGLHPRRPRFRARTRSRAARRRWSCSGRWGWACPRWSSRTCARRCRVAAARFYGDPTARAARRGHHRHQRQDHDRVPRRARCSRARASRPGCSGRSSRSSAVEDRAVVRTTPEAFDLQRTFREMLDAGDVACAMEISSHALELKRADRHPRRGGRVHQPDPGSPRLPSHDGGLLPGQAAAVRLAADADADRQRGLRLRAAADRGVRLRDLRHRP